MAFVVSVGHASTPWEPVVGIRDVNSFNLLDRNTTLGATLRASCTDPVGKSLYMPFGCPNLGVIEMDSIAIENESQEADMVATVVATSGLPAAVMAYFDVASNFNLTASKCTSGCSSVIAKLLQRDFEEVVSVSASAFASIVAFQSIVEFKDTDNNGIFEAQVDEMVSTYDFLTPSKAEQPLWGPISAMTKQAKNGATQYILNVSTQDNVFSLEYIVSDADMDPDTSSTKISVQIANFPYKATDGSSKLALLTYLGAARAGASVSTTSGPKMSMTSGGFTGWFSWVETATAGGVGDVPVKYTSWADIGGVEEMGLLTSLASVAFLNGGTTHAVKASYFSFDTVAPQYVYWDPELVFGGPTTPSPGGTNLAVILVTVASCAAVLAFGIALVLLYRRSRKQTMEFGVLGSPTRDGRSPQPLLQAAGHTNYATGVVEGQLHGMDDAASDDTYITPLTGNGSVYVSAEQVAASSATMRAPAALVTCKTCKYTGMYGEGFCSNCGSVLPA